MTKSKTATAIAMFLILTTSLTVLPAIKTVQALDFYAYISVAPDPVGVGQQVIIVAGFTLATRDLKERGFRVYEDWTVTITKPDGTTQIRGPFDADPTGSFSTTFVPDAVGVWKFQANYPGGYADFLDRLNVSIPAEESNVFSLTVQEEQLTFHEGSPLPTQWWQFPIYGENFEWREITQNWLQPGYDMGGLFGTIKNADVPYTTVPDTGHVLWTKSNLFGGIIGGSTPMTYFTGSIYRGELQPGIVINGRLYYNVMEPPRHGWYCVDIHTGETVWYINGTYPDGKGGLIQGQDAQLTLGQILTLDNFNWHGGIPYLWSTGATTWAVWDAWSGSLLYTIANAPARTTATRGYPFVTDPSTGYLYTYVYDLGTRTLVKWSAIKMINDTGVGGSLLGTITRERPRYNVDWRAGIVWNVTLPIVPGGWISTDDWVLDPRDYSVLIATNQTRSFADASQAFEDLAISMVDGRVLWRKVRDEGTWELVIGAGARVMSIEEDVYAIFRKETRQFYAYRISTGQELWVSDPYPSQWAQYLSGGLIADGKLFTNSYDGKVWALDVQTGDVVWDWGPAYAGLETPFGHYPFYGGITAADGKLVVAHGEHSANSPLYRGQSMFVIDEESGETIWEISGVYQLPIVANGYILAPNGYDGKIYAFGKGPSALTVTAPDLGAPLGTSVMIRGMVTDISAGSRQPEQAANFPNGVPAVSDDSMSAWMEYVYMQKPCPANATGVPVIIDVIDANGNYRNIGEVTSDAQGFFRFAWKPDIPGEYTVVARFAGSASYYPSSAETAFVVDEAPEPTVAPTNPPASLADQYLLPATGGIIAAIAIVGIAILLMLRKK